MSDDTPRKLVGAAASFRPWSIGEETILRMRYEEDGAAVLGKRLGRSWRAVFAHATRLGIPRRKRRWTDYDTHRLGMLWETTLTLSAIAKKLERTEKTTYWKAQQLGLPLGMPDGYEYLSAAAARTGYETSQLRRILEAGAVKLYTVRARPEGKRRSRHQHYVDAFDVDEAVTKWLERETVESAARRLSMVGETLRQWLRDAGHKPPEHKRAQWRLPSAVIDAVVTERRSKVSLRQAAMACKVCEATLIRALRRAGLPRPPGKLWLLRLEDARRVLTEFPPKRSTRGQQAARQLGARRSTRHERRQERRARRQQHSREFFDRRRASDQLDRALATVDLLWGEK